MRAVSEEANPDNVDMSSRQSDQFGSLVLEHVQLRSFADVRRWPRASIR